MPCGGCRWRKRFGNASHGDRRSLERIADSHRIAPARSRPPSKAARRRPDRTPDGKIDYNRDIRPILSDNCFHCHGPDKNHRKGKLRLDDRDAAVAKKAIVPGKPDESELVDRIFTDDADELMPPPKSHKTLTDAQKDTAQAVDRRGGGVPAALGVHHAGAAAGAGA